MSRHCLCCGCREHTAISFKNAQVMIAKSLHRRKGWSSLTSCRWKEEIVGRDTEWSPQGSDASEDTEASFCLARGAACPCCRSRQEQRSQRGEQPPRLCEERRAAIRITRDWSRALEKKREKPSWEMVYF